MSEWEWIVCKGCNKTGWLDLNQPMNQTGWTHKYFINSQDENVNFFLCDNCDCKNCSLAFITTGYNEDGSTYPDIECQDEGEGCEFLHCLEVNKK